VKFVDTATGHRTAGPPDLVARDSAALGSAEDLDEDRLRVHPLEAAWIPRKVDGRRQVRRDARWNKFILGH
jgi:hypothetical protein